MPFEDLTKDKALAKVKPLTAWEKSTLEYLLGNHWQGGDVWVGPPDADVANRKTTLETKVKPIFVSKNIIKEITESHRDAVTGNEPDWSATTREPLPNGQEPPAPTQKLIDVAEMALTEWWDARQALGVIQDATTNLLATGRGPLRLVVPSAFVAEDGTPKPGDLKTWLGRIYLEAPSVDSAAIITDDETRQQAGVFAVEKQVDQNGQNTKEKRVEICFVLEDGRTLVRVWRGDSEKAEEATIDLAGNLLIFQMRRSPLITEQIRQNQALFNTTLTMRTRNVGVGGFPERTFLNASPPSHLEDDPDEPNKKKIVYDDFKVGAGVTNFVVGNEVLDENGQPKGLTNASVSYRDPVKVETFEQTERAAYQNILEEARQLHRLIARDATASGESRIQARADFVTSLRDTKTQVDAAGRWVLETVLLLAAALSNSTEDFKSLRFRYESELDTGPLSPEERRLIREESQGERPVRSWLSAIKVLGADDPQAMMEEILSQDGGGQSGQQQSNGQGVPVSTPDAAPEQASTAVQ